MTVFDIWVVTVVGGLVVLILAQYWSLVLKYISRMFNKLFNSQKMATWIFA